MTHIKVVEGSDIVLREGFMENSIIMKFTNFYLEANDWSNCHMREFFQDLFLACFMHLILSQKYWI